jgi:hypothetical protein
MMEKELSALVCFLPELERLTPGEGEPNDATGIAQFEFYASGTPQSAILHQFVAAAYRNGWVRPSINWPTWMGTEEARLLYQSPEELAKASVDQLASLITVCIRQDRFVDGSLAGHFASGFILRILRRARVLLEVESSRL